MARLFDDAIPHYISASSAVLSGVPITMACWFNTDDIITSNTLMAISDTGADEDYFLLNAQGAEPGEPVRANAFDGVGSANADTSTGFSINTWHHACGVFTAIDNIAVFIDGGSKVSNATSATPAGLDSTSLGALVITSVVVPFSGLIAEAAIWNIALSDAEVAVLAEGYSPLLVRPQNLVFYTPLVREILDVVGGVALTNTGSTIADHTRIIYPAPPLVAVPAAVVAAIASQRLKIGLGR